MKKKNIGKHKTIGNIIEEQFVYYNNGIKIKRKLKMTLVKCRCHQS